MFESEEYIAVIKFLHLISCPTQRQPGDIVAVQHGVAGRKEGLVIGSHIDYAGRQILEVQLDQADVVYNFWYPTVTRVKRTVYSKPRVPVKHRTVERTIMW